MVELNLLSTQQYLVFCPAAKQKRFLTTCSSTNGSNYVEFREIYRFVFFNSYMLQFIKKFERFHFFHHHHKLDPILSPSTELAGFRMVIVFTTPRHFV